MRSSARPTLPCLLATGILALCCLWRPESSSATTLLTLPRKHCESLLAKAAGSPESLRQAAKQDLVYLNRLAKQQAHPLPGRRISVCELISTVHTLVDTLDSNPRDWARHVCQSLDLSRVEVSEPLLVTGYYQPVLQARQTRDVNFQHPIYQLPPKPTRYTRAEIDAGALKTGTPVVAWLDDPIDLFFLHIQGSGLLEFPDGTRLQVGYAGSNGYPYRSIGKWLVEQGKMRRDEVTMHSLKAYLHNHPNERDAILQVNERYIFFRALDAGPIGSLNVPLTAGRSIAADPTVYAAGLPALLVLDSASAPRLVFVQDSGSAIIGANRLDLFTGTGNAAGISAGGMRKSGELFLLLPSAPLSCSEPSPSN